MGRIQYIGAVTSRNCQREACGRIVKRIVEVFRTSDALLPMYFSLRHTGRDPDRSSHVASVFACRSVVLRLGIPLWQMRKRFVQRRAVENATWRHVRQTRVRRTGATFGFAVQYSSVGRQCSKSSARRSGDLKNISLADELLPTLSCVLITDLLEWWVAYVGMKGAACARSVMQGLKGAWVWIDFLGSKPGR